MVAGRALDELIAEVIMGSRRPVTPEGVWPTELHEWQDLMPLYSSDIAAAWKIVDVMRQYADGHDWFTFSNANGINKATFKTGAYYEPTDFITADTPALAICLAALDKLKKR